MAEPMPPDAKPAGDLDEPPPILGTWRNVYVLVLGELAFLVVAFWLLRRWAE